MEQTSPNLQQEEVILSVTITDYRIDKEGVVWYKIIVVTNFREVDVERRYSQILAWKSKLDELQILETFNDLPHFPGKWRTAGDPETRQTMLNVYFRYLYEEARLATNQPVFTEWLLDTFIPENMSSGKYKLPPLQHPVPVDHAEGARVKRLDDSIFSPTLGTIAVEVAPSCPHCGQVLRSEDALR